MAQKKMGRPLSGEKPLKDRIFVLVDDETQQKLAASDASRSTAAS